MGIAQIAPLVVSVVVGLAVGLMTSRVRWARGDGDDNSTLGAFHRNDQVLLALLVVAAFTLGSFLTYILLNVRP